ncbi:CAP domain-containing protein [uncultured Jannaschia sp.]|uniref:CAP domain-containing protein n=1 Tax=uncultured Jannaschia sp. TaxID=293347 RepID=UPI002634E00E|nr:CAP domain-containing protein [uncultured Jannaschia sp.]
MTMRFLISVVVGLCLALGAQAGPMGAATAYRAAAGLAPVADDARLMRAAQAQANHMARRGRIGHDGPGGSTVFERVRDAGFKACFAAENVAAGQGDLGAVMRDWLASSGHRRNILDRRVTHGAVAAAQARGTVYWTMVLAGRC